MQPQTIGAVAADGSAHFALWAQGKSMAQVEIEGIGLRDMLDVGDGYFRTDVPGVGPGARYWFRLDGGQRLPDLASRWQPVGNSGPSLLMSNEFAWTDAAWPGCPSRNNVLYEVHIGTFTEEGTWEAAADRLEALAELGVTVVQLMPAAAFEGEFGWGYDTTFPFAPFAPYGTPNDLRRFIDRAHAIGIAVILDVVYNHSSRGAVYREYSDFFFTDRHKNEWGESFNFDGGHSRAVRDFFIANAVYWIADFHFDGLRIDAVQALQDDSHEHILSELTRAARNAAGKRQIYVVVENQPQERRMIDAPERGGCGVDAMCNDDFHHACRVAMTGHSDFYYRDYLGSAQELVSAIKYGFLYQGQRSDMRDAPYGTDNLDTRAEHFLHFLENHDQIANSATGSRLSRLVTPARLRAFTALLLLGPQTPCLFQGQEFGSSHPFLYFRALKGAEAVAVSRSRTETLSNFLGVADPEMLARMPDPSDPATFQRCKLDWSEAARNTGIVALHHDLLQLRRQCACLDQAITHRVDGAVIAPNAVLIRYLTQRPEDQRLLLVNWGADLSLKVMPEPLSAPPAQFFWQAEWSSDHPRYGGAGRVEFHADGPWQLPADSALLLRAVRV